MKSFDRQLHSGEGRRSFLRQCSLGAAGIALGSLAMSSPARALAKSGKSTVTLRYGKDRRELVYQALKPFQKEVEKGIGDRKVVVKVNAGLAEPRYIDCSTHVDEIRGILDFLKPIYDREVIIAEGTASIKCGVDIGYENYGYMPIEKEYKKIKFVDANLTPYSLQWIYAANHSPQAINIIDMYMDPDVYLISAARMKSHNCVVGTFSLKNVLMGAPVCHWKKKGPEQINEKSLMHGGKNADGGRELSYNLFRVATMGVVPDLSIIDGVVGIEGNGPWDGNPIEQGVVVASTDPVAADRLCTELTGIDPRLMKYVEWCGDAGFGNFDMKDIKVDGPNYKDHIVKFKMNDNFDWQVKWIYDNFEM